MDVSLDESEIAARRRPGLLVFPESPIDRDQPAGPGRWFFYYFLALTAIYALFPLAALINQVVNFLAAVGFRPIDPAFSFDIGIYGIATLAIVALVILRDPIWRGKGSNLS